MPADFLAAHSGPGLSGKLACWVPRPGHWRSASGRGLAVAVAVLAAVASSLSAAAGGAAESAPQGVGIPYDLVVIVMAGSEGQAQVALSYAEQVNHRRLRAAIGSLAAETGARLSGVATADEAPERGSRTLATGAEFTATGLLEPGRGRLPVSAFAEALPDWRRMRLVFVVGEAFPFTGPNTYTGPDFSIALIKHAGEPGEPRSAVHVYEYDVVRMNGGTAPTAASGRQPPKRPARAGAPFRRLRTPAAVALAIGALAAAWFVLSRARRRAADARGSARESIEETTVTENGSKEDGA